MTSNQGAQNISSTLPSIFEGKVDCYWYQGGGVWEILRIEQIIEMTVREFVCGPYVFRFEIPGAGKVYFAGDDEAFLKLDSEGKTVRWLHDLFEGWRQKLITLGLPKKVSIYRWTIHDMYIHEVALKIFPGSKVEVFQ